MLITGDYHYRKTDGALVFIGWLRCDSSKPMFYWAIPVADILKVHEDRLTVIAPDRQEMTAGNFLANEIPWETIAWGFWKKHDS